MFSDHESDNYPFIKFFCSVSGLSLSSCSGNSHISHRADKCWGKRVLSGDRDLAAGAF